VSPIRKEYRVSKNEHEKQEHNEGTDGRESAETAPAPKGTSPQDWKNIPGNQS
jgi:hypothetical protein